MPIHAVISFLLASLSLFQTSLAETRLDDNYVTTWGETSSLQQKFGDSVQVSFRISTADDGFQTSYVTLSPRDRKIHGTAVLLHGFDREGQYWVDSGFVQGSKLLEHGYRVILPDLMVRGRTRDLNFTLDPKGQWNPNEQQQKWIQHVTGDQQAKYIVQLLKNEKASAQDFGPLTLVGHSYGALVAGYVAYQMGLENLRAEKIKSPLPWQVRSLQSLNGFLIYTTMPIQTRLESDKYRETMLMHLEKMLPLTPLLQGLKNKTVEDGDEKELKSARILDVKIKPLLMTFISSFEGLGEAGFVNLVMQGFDQELDKHGRSRYNSRAIYDREQQLTEAMMSGLRTVYKLNVNLDGSKTFLNRNIMIPDSVLGIYRLLYRGKLPGIQELKLIVGKNDSLIPLKLTKAALPNGPSRIAFDFQAFETDHFGPETDIVQLAFRQDIATPWCRATFH